MNDLLTVPTFARLADYLGIWSMESNTFAVMRQLLSGMDLASHFADHANDQIKAATEMVSAAAGKSIAMVKLTGILMKSASSMGGTSTIQARREIRQAANDPQVSGILLAIDSPGGTVSGTDDLAREIKAAAKLKPLWSHIEDLGASAAYWVATQASRITANSPTAMVGGIGTYQAVQDLSEAAQKAGVKTLLFATGPLKGLGTPGTKVTDEQAQHLQSLVETVQLSFDSAVQKGRGLTNTQLAAVKHGGVMTATQAQDAKLIDAVQPLSKTIAEFSQAIKTGGMAADWRPEEHKAQALGMLPMLAHGLPMLARK